MFTEEKSLSRRWLYEVHQVMASAVKVLDGENEGKQQKTGKELMEVMK